MQIIFIFSCNPAGLDDIIRIDMESEHNQSTLQSTITAGVCPSARTTRFSVLNLISASHLFRKSHYEIRTQTKNLNHIKVIEATNRCEPAVQKDD